MLRLTLFGRFSLVGTDGAQIPLKSQKAKALLAYLALSPDNTRSREEIMALLWSDRGDTQARASLRQVLFGLKKTLNDEVGAVLNITDDAVSFNPELIAINSGSGELLSGFHLSDPAFEEWLRDERLRSEDEVSPNTEPSAPAVTEKPSIAVLPFTNMSGDPEQEYFSDGLTEDIITELSRFRSLAVIARSSTFAYKGLAVDVGDVGGKLNVNYLVEGSVRRAGSRVRVTAQLIEVETGAHMWADRYDRSLEDIFAVQDDLVTSIVARLGFSLNDAATIRSKNRPTEILGAYDYLLQARSAWWRGRINDAFELTHRSVEADPTFAAAQAYLSLQYAYQSFGSTAGLTKKQIAEKARFHAEAALDLDDTDPFVHASASMAFGFSPVPNKERGFKHINIAVSLNPHDWELTFLLAWQLSFMGRSQDALAVLDKFQSLNPLGGYMVSECLGDTYYMMGEYETALQSYKDQTGTPPQALAVFAACHAQLGRIDEAKACLAELGRIKPVGFELLAFAEAQIAVCAQEEDRENWRKGFRLAGVDV